MNIKYKRKIEFEFFNDESNDESDSLIWINLVFDFFFTFYIGLFHNIGPS